MRRTRGGVVLSVILSVEALTKCFVSHGNLKSTPLKSSHGNTIGLTIEAIMRIKLPALVDKIIIIGSGVPNKVSILIGRVIHATSTILVILVHLIE
jgi:hypothetical protein